MNTHKNTFDLFDDLASYFRSDELKGSMDTLGETLKKAGMKRSEDHANELVVDWSIKAMNALKRYVRHISYNDTFFGEDIREYAYEFCLLERPVSERAWGSILIRAKKLGLIRCVGIGQVKNKLAHRANANIYKKV